jgi:RNA polymerase sigma-70 factor (ECF subfamily)
VTVSPRDNQGAAPPRSPDEAWPAFETFVREQHPSLCAYAYRYVRSCEAAEEVVQDVLFRVWCRRDRLTEIELIPYVYRSVANAAISRVRSERAMLARDLHLAQAAADLGPTDQPDTGSDLHSQVRRAIEALPERTRLVFLLSRDAGLTYAAIAERLGISPKTVENQIVRALRLLRAALKPHLVLPLALAGAADLLRKLL